MKYFQLKEVFQIRKNLDSSKSRIVENLELYDDKELQDGRSKEIVTKLLKNARDAGLRSMIAASDFFDEYLNIHSSYRESLKADIATLKVGVDTSIEGIALRSHARLVNEKLKWYTSAEIWDGILKDVELVATESAKMVNYKNLIVSDDISTYFEPDAFEYLKVNADLELADLRLGMVGVALGMREAGFTNAIKVVDTLMKTLLQVRGVENIEMKGGAKKPVQDCTLGECLGGLVSAKIVSSSQRDLIRSVNQRRVNIEHHSYRYPDQLTAERDIFVKIPEAVEVLVELLQNTEQQLPLTEGDVINNQENGKEESNE